MPIWITLATRITIFAVRQYAHHRQPVGPDSSQVEDGPDQGPLSEFIPIDERVEEWPCHVIWARVEFGPMVHERKVRPVVVFNADDEGLLVLPMSSRAFADRTGVHNVQISPESAVTFDPKGRCGFVQFPRLVELPWSAVVPDNDGQLSLTDRRKLVAAYLEWGAYADGFQG